MNERKTLSNQQQEDMRLALTDLPMDIKCNLSYESEQAVKKGEYKGTVSEYKYDQLFINRDSKVFRVL